MKKVVIFLGIILPLFFSLKPIIQGAMPFWNDPARDLLLAWNNLRKISLIGPTSGIPGIFYGPHWIWILSSALIFSKDPRFVVLLTTTIPYFIIFPFLLWRLPRDLFSRFCSVSLWLLFILAYGGYTTQIWSPNLAALFYFIIIYIFIKTGDVLLNIKKTNFFLLGFFQGLLLNHQISFGVGIMFSWVIYYLINFIRCFFNKKNTPKRLKTWIVNLVFFLTGFTVIMSPYFIFELRHGFNQTKSLIYTLSQGFIHNQAVVSKIGLTKPEIIIKSIEPLAVLLSLPKSWAIYIFILLIAGLIYYFIFSNKDKSKNRIIFFLSVNYFGVMLVYLTTRNPVWNYHFIGLEIIYLFITGLLINKSKVLDKIVLTWSIILLCFFSISFFKNFRNRQIPELTAKINNTKNIFQDAGGEPFVYLAKNAAIYTYDYDYLFRWLSLKYNYLPHNFISNEKTVYLIIPKEMRSDQEGFTENRTPKKEYITVNKWQTQDGSLIIRRYRR